MRTAWLWPVTLLAFCHLQAIASMQVVNILVDPIKLSLHISDTQYSLLQGAALAVFAVVVGLPVARIADRASRRNIILLGVLGWSAGSLLCAVAQTFAQLLAARALVGIGEIVLFPAALSMIYDLAPRQRLATAIGLFGSGGPLGAALALIGGGWLLSLADETGRLTDGLPGVAAWRIAFLACAVFGLFAVAGLLTIREPVRHTAGAASAARVPLGRHLQHAWPVYAGVSGGFILLSTAVFAVNAWAPTFLVRVHHLGYEAAGRLTGLAAIGCAVAGAWCAGLGVDYLQRRRRDDGAVLASGVISLSLAAAIAGAVYSTSLLAAAIFLCVAYFLLGMPTVLGGTALQQISPSHLRAQIMAAHVLLVNVFALSAGPTAVALLTDRYFASTARVGYSIAITVLATTALAAFLLLQVRRPFVAARAASAD
ncbi:MAG TPA: MFS transporter [Steroidobacteraceae bacterium]|nr:MFS transporter [Steroidobacteraceae bacterium]